MNVWAQIFGNQLLMSAVTRWVVTQFLKTLIGSALDKSFDAGRLVGSDDMPSSRSTMICSLATTILLEYGADSFELTVSSMLSMIVMYNAIGVRREAGKQTKLLNSILSENPLELNAKALQEKLREYVGHTSSQVLARAILGIELVLALNPYY